MPQTLIGVTTGEIRPIPKDDKKPYTLAVEEAGGTPELIPADLSSIELDDILKRLDGLLFTGGGDVDPSRFNGIPHPSVHGISTSRDATEIGLAWRARDLSIPFLGICRGCQVINVAFGGSLYTHINDQFPGALEHSNDRSSPERHTVRVELDSLLRRITGKDSLEVNSRHHQGILQIAESLTPSAFARDGLVEALELKGHPFGLSVQWHPEDLTSQPEMAALFVALIHAAGEFHDRVG
jgi:putative glutamine amidotransferase